MQAHGRHSITQLFHNIPASVLPFAHHVFSWIGSSLRTAAHAVHGVATASGVAPTTIGSSGVAIESGWLSTASMAVNVGAGAMRPLASFVGSVLRGGGRAVLSAAGLHVDQRVPSSDVTENALDYSAGDQIDQSWQSVIDD